MKRSVWEVAKLGRASVAALVIGLPACIVPPPPDAEESNDSSSDAKSDDKESEEDSSDDEMSSSESDESPGDDAEEKGVRIRASIVDEFGDVIYPARLKWCGASCFTAITDKSGKLVKEENQLEFSLTPKGDYHFEAWSLGDESNWSRCAGHFRVDKSSGDFDIGTCLLLRAPKPEFLDEDETKEFEVSGGLRVEIDAAKLDWLAIFADPSFAGVGVDVKDLRDDEIEIDGNETIAAWAFVPFGVPAIDGESLPFSIDDDLGLDEGDDVAAYVRVAGDDSETAGRLVKVGEGSVDDGAIEFDGGLTWISWLYITKR